MNAPASATCYDDRRSEAVRASQRNGIDYLEAEHDPRILNVYLFHEAPERIAVENVQIAGGFRVRDIKVLELRIVRPGGAVGDARLQVVVDRPGDLSAYTLSMVETDAEGVPTKQPMAEFDPFYASIEFKFREGGTADLDCKQPPLTARADPGEPDINYLAKDYASFRQLILDRLALIMPTWTEAHVPDIGIALIEILAYVGDYLSYYQDAVATEAYLNTARQRVSVRRHLRLLNYRMHDGCNARTWICVAPEDPAAHVTVDSDSLFFISADDSVSGADLQTLALGNTLSALANQIDVFEPVVPGPIHVFGSHTAIPFYSWGNAQCHLPMGATRATLRDGWDQCDPPRRTLHLRAGDFLCFEQVLGATTGDPADTDPTQRHVVRLTRVETSVDVLFDPAVPIVEIEWAPEDAIPFRMLLSAIGPAPDCALIENIARGNVLLVDDGFRIVDEWLGAVPLQDSPAICSDVGVATNGPVTSGPFQPILSRAALVFAEPVVARGPASALLNQDPALAVPWIRLVSIAGKPDGSGPLFTLSDLANSDALITRLAAPTDVSTWYLRAQLSHDTRTQLGARAPADPISDALRAQIVSDLGSLVRHWVPKLDLLASRSEDPDFVVEMDDAGFAHLRFGDGSMGRAPEAGETFSATYRVDLGAMGHVGAESITRTIIRPGAVSPGVLTPRNPLAAQGRVPPQSMAEARTLGPGSFSNHLERAVTAQDYATLAQRNPKVQRAAASMLWTGSRYEAHVAIDPLGEEAVDARLLREIQVDLQAYRRIGHDVIVVAARYVPIDLRIAAQVLAGHSRSHVERALLDALSNRALPGGGRGFFHPDNLTFGESIHVSKLLAAAQAVPGVQSVQVQKLERLFQGPNQQVENGVLPIGPMEVARLDNIAGQPENGRLVIELKGGR